MGAEEYLVANQDGYDELPRQPARRPLWPYLLLGVAFYFLFMGASSRVPAPVGAPKPHQQQLDWNAADVQVAGLSLGIPNPPTLPPGVSVLTGAGNQVWSIEGPNLKCPSGQFAAGSTGQELQDKLGAAPAEQSTPDCLVWRGSKFVLKVRLSGQAATRFELAQSIY